MTVVKIENLKIFKDRHGKVRLYYRAKGKRLIALRGPVGSPEFWEDYNAARTDITAVIKPGLSGEVPGSISALIAEYYESFSFKNLGPAAQATYRSVLEGLRKDHGRKSVKGLRRYHVEIMMDDKADTPGAAYSLLKRLKTLLNYAIKREYRIDNPAMLVKAPSLKGIRPLTDDDIEQYLKYWTEQQGSRQVRAMMVLLYTGQRRSDAVKLGRQHVKDGRISLVQQKTGARLWIKIHPRLQAEIDLMPADHMLFIASERGLPLSPESFSNMFCQWCDDAKLPEASSPHGVRKAAGRRLAEAGNSTKQIAAVLGHVTLTEVERYTRDAEQMLLADEAIDRLA